MGAGWVSIELGTKGPLMSECTACAASNMAIGDALDEIRMGRADAMIAGGTEAPITKVGIAGFDAMRALSRRNDDPKRASRPFDNGRDGLVMGEAAGVLVLEELTRAQARGAKIYAELLGYGMSADAAHMTEPDPTGQSPARAMKMAIADARVDPTEVGYVNAHATSTPLGDSAETKVLKLALGEEHARRTPISSTKGATGHCFGGAAGAIEAIFTMLALQRRSCRRRSTTRTADPDCDLDYVPNEAREVPGLEVAVSNSFGFGGHNASIVIRRWKRIGSGDGARWATFDCYGTLIDWNGGIRAELARVFGEERADELLEQYHELERELEHDGSLSYREVMTEAMRRLGAPGGRGGRARRVAPVLAALPGGARGARGGAAPRLEARDPLELRPRPDRRVEGAPRRAVRRDRGRRGDRLVQAGARALAGVRGTDGRRPGPPRPRRGEPLPRHRARRTSSASRRLDQPARRAPRAAADERAAGPLAPARHAGRARATAGACNPERVAV